MKLSRCTLAICFILLATCGWIATAKRIMVQTHPNAARPDEVASGIGRVIRSMPSRNFFVIEVNDNADLNTIRGHGSVAHVSEDYGIRIGTVDSVNDPRVPDQWALNALNASQVWSTYTVDPASNILIAVCDSGIYYDHEDLQIDFIKGKDYVDDDLEPLDANGHGTHVAGIIAATANNAKGIAGFAFGIKLWIGRPFDASGNGYASDMISCIYDAIDADANIVSVSSEGTYGDFFYEQVMNIAVQSEMLPIVCGGNQEGIGDSYPGVYPSTLSVANMNSNYQRSPTSNIADYQDIAAPGENIMSTVIGVSAYDYMTGCSMATPYVSAVAGLIWSAKPSLTNLELRAILENTAIDIGEPGKDTSFGHGLVNPLGALQCKSPSTNFGLLISFADVLENAPPVVTPTDIFFLEGSEISFFINCTGPEAYDTCELSVTDLPSFLTQEQVSQSSVLVSGTASSLGQFVLRTSATDSLLAETQQDVTLTIDTELPPLSSGSPSNSPSGSPSAFQGPGSTPKTKDTFSGGCTLFVSCLVMFLSIFAL